MGNASNGPEATQAEQAAEATTDAEAMDVVVEAFDPRQTAAEAAEQPRVVEIDEQRPEDERQGSGDAHRT